MNTKTKTKDINSFFSPDAVTEARRQPLDSRKRLVLMDPLSFLAVAKSGFDSEKESGVKALLQAGEQFECLPFLNFVHDGEGSARVVGHEGRHRARALLEMGVEQIPVILNHVYDENGQAMSWGLIEANSTTFTDEWPHRLFGERGYGEQSDLHKHNAIPFPVPDLRLNPVAQQAYADSIAKYRNISTNPLESHPSTRKAEEDLDMTNNKSNTKAYDSNEIDKLLSELGVLDLSNQETCLKVSQENKVELTQINPPCRDVAGPLPTDLRVKIKDLIEGEKRNKKMHP